MKKRIARIMAVALTISFVVMDMAPMTEVYATGVQDVVLSEDVSETDVVEESEIPEIQVSEEAESETENVSEEPTENYTDEMTQVPSEEECTDENLDSEENVNEEETEFSEELSEEFSEPVILVHSVEELDEGLLKGANVGIAISEEIFPDELFREYLRDNFDKNADDIFDAEEIEKIEDVDIRTKNIADLKGIEYLRYLRFFNCNQTSIRHIDISKNVRLEKLYISDTLLTELDVTKNVMLKVLVCGSNDLAKLDVSKNTELEELAFDWTGIKEINLRNCKKLYRFHSYSTNLEKLDLSQNTELGYLDVISCRLKKLDVSKNVNLVSLNCSQNPISSLDVSKCKKLESLDCNGTDIKKLNLSQNTCLKKLICSYVGLQTLDVSRNFKLQTLKATETDIKQLDLSQNLDLRTLDISDTLIEELDLSANLKLSSLYCSGSRITSMDLTNNENLSSRLYSTYKIELDENNQFDLSTLPGDIDLTRVKTSEGTSLDGSVLSFEDYVLEQGYAAYEYRCSENVSLRVTLSFSPCELTISINGAVYYNHGKPCIPTVRVTFGNRKLVQGTDYMLFYKNNVKAAGADAEKVPTVIVKGKGNYSFTKEVKFEIYPYYIDRSFGSDRLLLQLNDVHLKYNGKVQKGIPVVTYSGKKIPVSELVFEYPDTREGAYKEPGVYDIVIKGAGKNYEGEYTVKQYIEGAKSISKASVKFDAKSYEYNDVTGLTVPNEITVKVGTEELIEGEDYTIAYTNNTSVGKATAVITGIGEYSGVKKATYQITGQKLKATDFEMLYTDIWYSYYAVKLSNGEHYNTSLREGIDYMVSTAKTIENVGTYKVTFKGIGGYTGSVTKTIKVKPISVEDCSIMYEKATDTYSFVSSGVKPKPVVMDCNYRELIEGRDYTIVYKNNKKIADKNSDKAPQFYIKGIGNYTGTTEKSPVKFSIVPMSLQDSVTLSVENVLYKNKKNNHVPKFTITEASTGKKLSAKKDYSETVYEYQVDGVWNPVTTDRVPADATALRITVKAAEGGNFSGEISTEYHFYTKQISKVKVGTISAKTYTRQQIRPLPVVTVSEKKDGKTTTVNLVRGKDYVLEYGKNVNAGTGTVTIRGIGEYGGTKTVKFKIQAAKK